MHSSTSVAIVATQRNYGLFDIHSGKMLTEMKYKHLEQKGNFFYGDYIFQDSILEDSVYKKVRISKRELLNSKGEILNSVEVYSDMRLPLSLINLILNENKEWYITNNTQIIKYNHNKDSYKLYKVEIKNKNEHKQLKFKIDMVDNNITYVVFNNTDF